jgi:hypothetical protein
MISRMEFEEPPPAVEEIWTPHHHGLRDAVSEYVKERPLRAIAQAAAVGYAVHLLSVRSVLTVATRLAIPGLFLAGAWKLCKRLDAKTQK